MLNVGADWDAADMEENLLYPLLLSAITAVVAVLARDRSRASLERRIDFYTGEENRQGNGRYKDLVAATRVRVQARLIAIDQVRQTAAWPAVFFLVLSGSYLILGARDLALDRPSDLAAGSLAIGAVTGVLAAHCVLALVRCFEARREVVIEVLGGSVPADGPLSPIDDLASYRPWPRACLVYLLTLSAPLALGKLLADWDQRAAADGALIAFGVVAYFGLGWLVFWAWRRVDLVAGGSRVKGEALKRLTGGSSPTG